ncbi:carbohydrate porin [Escherichia coli]
MFTIKLTISRQFTPALKGSHKFTQQAQIEYLLAFHDYDNSSIKSDNRKNYGVIVRPMYFWNDVHSTSGGLSTG